MMNNSNSFNLHKILISIFLLGTLSNVVHGQEILNTPDLEIYEMLYDGKIDKESIPMEEAYWFFYMNVSKQEEKKLGAGIEYLENTVGINQDRANALFAHIENALNTNRVDSATDTRELCDSKNKAISRKSLATLMHEWDEKSKARHGNHMMSVSQVLDSFDEQKLTQWIDEGYRPTLKIIEIDYETYFDMEDIDPNSLVERVCSKYDVR